MDLYHGSIRGLGEYRPARMLQMTPYADTALDYATGENVVDPDRTASGDASVVRFGVDKQNLPLELLAQQRFVKPSELKRAAETIEKKNQFRKELETTLAGQDIPKEYQAARQRGILRQIARAIGKATGGRGGRLSFSRGRQGEEINVTPYMRPRLPIHTTGIKYAEDDMNWDEFVPTPISKRNPPESWVATKHSDLPVGTVVPPKSFSIKPFFRPGISVSGIRGIPLFGTKRMGI